MSFLQFDFINMLMAKSSLSLMHLRAFETSSLSPCLAGQQFGCVKYTLASNERLYVTQCGLTLGILTW